VERHAFTPTVLLIWSGLLIWMTDFLFVYVFAALACARRFADVEIFGVGIVAFATVVATVAAGLATTVMMWSAARRLQQASTDRHSRFIFFVTAAAGGLGLIALLWVAIPALVLSTKCD
jgi:threonine dehydrogenase-like Zn-dependent dehydrogenase